MGKDRNLLRFHDINVVVTNRPDEDIRKHISRTVLGTPGKMRYRQTDAIEKMETIKKIWFLSLRKKKRLLGTVGLVYRKVKSMGSDLNAYYIRYFSIFAPLRSTGISKRKNYKGDSKTGKQNFMKEKLLRYFDEMENLNPDPSEKNMGTLSYAFIEKENVRSMNFSNMMGYRSVREFETVYFSRFYPKASPVVRPVRLSEISFLKERLDEMYSNYTLFFYDHLFRNDRYFVLLEGNEIIAGVQAEPVQWEVIDMPGASGSIFMQIVPRLPLVSKLFRPREFSFAAFEGLWYKKDCEKKIPVLFESVCALLGLNVGLIWVDAHSPLSGVLKSLGNLGFLSKIKGSVPAAVRVKFVNIPPESQEQFFQKPVYISSFDLT